MKIYGLILAIIFCLIVSNNLQAQNKIIPDERLSIKYSHDYLSNLIENSPETIEYLNFSLDHSCYLITDNSDKFKNCLPLKFFDNTNKTITENIVSSIDLSTINIFLYNFELNYSQRTFYRIGTTNQILVFYSLKEMAERYNSFKNL